MDVNPKCPIIGCRRGDKHEHPDQCQKIDDIIGLAPGWGCCRCTIYNGLQRPRCKLCGHNRCDIDKQMPETD
jgi:hypothetical protein